MRWCYENSSKSTSSQPQQSLKSRTSHQSGSIELRSIGTFIDSQAKPGLKRINIPNRSRVTQTAHDPNSNPDKRLPPSPASLEECEKKEQKIQFSTIALRLKFSSSVSPSKREADSRAKVELENQTAASARKNCLIVANGFLISINLERKRRRSGLDILISFCVPEGIVSALDFLLLLPS